jgi:DNA invertase Pin-like site-specific DNA recombinase
MFGMLSVLAEFERDIIRGRTKVFLQAARSRKRKGGRPKINEKKLNHALALYISKSMSIKEIDEACGVSGSTLYRALIMMKLNQFR